MDILRDAWIPTDKGVMTPLVALREATRPAWTRGDWNAATLMFLHAIVQTAVVQTDHCVDYEEWFAYLESSPGNLDSWIDGLDAGDAPWQCPTAEKTTPVYSLLPESPGENTLKKSADIMMWRESAPTTLTQQEAMIAVIADQLWGIPAGAGHRGGCRGQYPLTIMVEADEFEARLWKKIWLNVLPKNEWLARMGGKSIPFEFPWKKAKPTTSRTPDNTNALEMLWQMPRRWRIVPDDDGLVRTMVLEAGGIVYEGWATHPLTAYRILKDKPDEIATVKTRTHLGFVDWAALAVGIDPSGIRIPIVVNAYIQELASEFAGRPLRLRCFGWASGDFGPAAWVETVVPFYPGTDHVPIERAVNVAKDIRTNLNKKLGRISKALPAQAEQLYQAIERSFYKRVSSSQWEDWESFVRREARGIFWQFAELHRFDTYTAAEIAKSI